MPKSEWTASPYVPSSKSLEDLQRAVQDCTGCPLYADTTQAVFGAGSRFAHIMLVGEQPGDQEDRHGHPFIGPAGRVLWECLDAAKIDPQSVYTTNAVKHFKHEVRGARRLHKKPTVAEVDACHPWIEAELRAVRPDVIVALGTTAARSLFGRMMPIAGSRIASLTVGDTPTLVTYHPSAVLRADDGGPEIRAALVEDLQRAKQLSGIG